jgi:peptidyl-prolyl cis-trans isomerase SurA
MKKLVKNLLAVSAICCSVGSFSQSSADAVLMTIDGKPVTKSEFETVFFKNNTSRTVADSKSISDYVELFINFKLKVREAEEMGLDTSKAFLTELNGYKKI